MSLTPKILASCILLLTSGMAVASPPNVVMIISDDQAWTDYGFMGHEQIETPHLDRLAAESLTFTRGYVPSSLCRPSLATMITGLYPHQHKIVGNDPARRPGRTVAQSLPDADYIARRHALINHIRNVPTLPRLLGEIGYVSHQSGKWWEGNYREGGFTAGMTRGFPERGGRHGDDGLTIGREGLEPVFEFVRQAQREEKPFFVWYAPFMPHTPHDPPERLLAKYRPKTDSLPIAKYWAMCEWFDETCGELLAFIDNAGLGEETLVVYVTDNGWINLPNESAYAPRSKRSPYEGGIRTPIMLRMPGTIEPKRDDQTLASSIDLAPTILQACGLPASSNLPGINLLDESQRSSRTTLYGEIFSHDVVDVDRPQSSLLYRWQIDGSWKLILSQTENAEDAPTQLFNLQNDPFEQHNLAAEQGDRVERMTRQLDQWWPLD